MVYSFLNAFFDIVEIAFLTGFLQLVGVVSSLGAHHGFEVFLGFVVGPLFQVWFLLAL